MKKAIYKFDALLMIMMIGMLTLFPVDRMAVASCPCPGTTPTWSFVTFPALIKSLLGTVASQLLGFNQANEQNEREIIKAVKVQAKQSLIDAQRESVATVNTMQQLSDVLIRQNAAFKAQDVLINYGATGQGFDPCGDLDRNKAVAEAYAQSRDVNEAIKEIDTAPGAYKNPHRTMADRLKKHKQFCTEAEEKLGICSSVDANLAGASLSFSTLYKSAKKDEPLSEAKDAFINTVFGLPDTPITADQANSPEYQAQMSDKRMRDGFRSIAATSLKSIQAMFELPKDSTAQKPVMDAIAEKVDLYSGGKNKEGSSGPSYNNWQLALTMQNERGLMIEYAKMSAFKLYLSSIEYDQYERIEANLAALLALENKKSGRGN